MLGKKEKTIEITFKNLPKISLNEWYAGNHWSKRVKIKNQYAWLIKSQYPQKLTGCYDVSYSFGFANNPLDASNCVAMIKLIEDCLFLNDGYKFIKITGIESYKIKKGSEENVKLEIKEKKL